MKEFFRLHGNTNLQLKKNKFIKKPEDCVARVIYLVYFLSFTLILRTSI